MKTVPVNKTKCEAQVVVTRGNPSRGKGYEIAHFMVRKGEIQNIPERDRFANSLAAAVSWVKRTYPGARLLRTRRDHLGKLAAVCFGCEFSSPYRR